MDHVLEFEKYLKEDGKRDSTILSYTGDVRGFLDYLASKGSPCERQVFLEKFRQIILDNLLPLLPKDCIAVL